MTKDEKLDYSDGEDNNEADKAAHGKKAGSFKYADKRWLWPVIIVVVVFLAWQGYVWWSGQGFLWQENDKYQAVFLDNNQVYFGKLHNADSDYPVLRDIYYLRVTRKLQPQDPEAAVAPDINLVKLGTELHGPTDEMKINKDHILFIEDLGENSQVVTAIKNFQEFQQAQQ